MKNKLISLILPAFGALACLMPLAVQGMESSSMRESPKHLEGMQLAPGAWNTLEAPLGTGANVLLKISMDLKDLNRLTEAGRVNVPVQLFLTDFTSSPTSHPPFKFGVNVDCDLAPWQFVLPDKPTSFDSYPHFKHWVKQAYFSNQVSITYDFQVDVQKLAPSLAQKLFFLPPNGYRFVGTHVIDNPKIISDRCVPEISYSSVRGNTNATTATLSGKFYLNKQSYLVEHKQIFPHRMIEKKIVKIDRSKHFYHYKELSKFQIMSKRTYEESFDPQGKNWPNFPAATYSILHTRWKNMENISHISCTDGKSGEEIDIRDGKVFWLECELARQGNIIENIVRDSENNLYIIKYRNLDEEKTGRTEIAPEDYRKFCLSAALWEHDQSGRRRLISKLMNNKWIQEKRRDNASAIYNKNPNREGCTQDCSDIRSLAHLYPFLYCTVCKPLISAYEEMSNAAAMIAEIEKGIKHYTDLEERSKHVIKGMMEEYQNQAGAPHPRWEEFSKM